MFVCAGNGEEFGFARKIGVGLIQSAINLTELCLNESVDSLIFVGSAGSYDDNLPLLNLCLSQEAVQIESSRLYCQSYTPIQLHQKSLDVSCETIDLFLALDLPRVVLNSSNYITTDAHCAKAMRKKGILLENMEFYSVLSVANAFRIPALGIFCVSNYCSAQAHADFMKNRLEAMRRLEEVVRGLTV